MNNEKHKKEMITQCRKWQKEQVEKELISRKERMDAFKGYDLRYTSEMFSYLCAKDIYQDNNYSLYKDELLIDCTDLNNPKEFFTGLPLNLETGIFIVDMEKDSESERYYSDWTTVDLVSNRLKNNFQKIIPIMIDHIFLQLIALKN